MANEQNYRVDKYGNVTNASTGAHVTQSEFQSLGLNVTQIPTTSVTYLGSGANTSTSQGVDAYVANQIKSSPSTKSSTSIFSLPTPQSSGLIDTNIVPASNVTGAGVVAGGSYGSQQNQYTGQTLTNPNNLTVNPQTGAYEFIDLTPSEEENMKALSYTPPSQNFKQSSAITPSPIVQPVLPEEETGPTQEQQQALADASAGIGSGAGSYPSFSGVSAANSMIADAQAQLSALNLLKIDDIRKIVNNPDFTKRLAARRQAYLDDPQNPYWQLYLEAQADVQIAQKEFGYNVDKWKALQPSIVGTPQTQKDGSQITTFYDPLSLKAYTMQTAKPGTFDTEDEYYAPQYVEGSKGTKVLMYAPKDSSKPIKYVPTDIPNNTSDSSVSFSDTQVAKGASSAGLSISQFGSLDEDIQNAYINNSDVMVATDADIRQRVANGDSEDSILSDLEKAYKSGKMSNLIYQHYVEEVKQMVKNRPTDVEDIDSAWWKFWNW